MARHYYAEGQPDSLGLGCHPRLRSEIEDFSPTAFSAALHGASFVGEVGLDAKGGASIEAQRLVFDEVLAVLTSDPRPVSIHSAGAATQVLDCIERSPQAGAILHWWSGTTGETRRAVELGCYFSINAAAIRTPRILDHIPPDRVLTETDFPHTGRHSPPASRPGDTRTIEYALQRKWALDEWGVRRQIWANLASLLRRTGTTSLMPVGIRKALLLLPEREPMPGAQLRLTESET